MGNQPRSTQTKVTVKQILSEAWQRHEKGDLDEAEAVYRHVIEQAPDSANAWCYLGIVLADQRRYTESADAYRQALELKADFPVAWNNYGNALRMLDQLEDADAAYETAIQQKPDYVGPWKNRGALWTFAGQLGRAIEAFKTGLRVEPDHAELHRNLGVIYLAQGRFEEGWREYAWRWRVGTLYRPKFQQPLWVSGSLKDKTILLYPEQGLGDTIHFVRFAKILQEQGATTVVQAAPRLIPLLTTCPGIDRLIPAGAAPGPIDCHCSLVEVAERLNINASDIPNTMPSSGHYLSSAKNLEDDWRAWFSRLNAPANSPSAGRKKIGICWQGNPDHQADVFRSIPLTEFEDLAYRDDLQLISLQFGHGTEQLEQVSFSDRIVRLPESVDRATDTFMDTAAILKSLDLVITSDTSIAHLAGALGVPVWVALPFMPDWRWGLTAETTDWYPSMRLFRQPVAKDWRSVFQQIDGRLQGLA